MLLRHDTGRGASRDRRLGNHAGSILDRGPFGYVSAFDIIGGEVINHYIEITIL